ncbi:Protein of unknown function DUF227,CHK kinase-like,Protein kinase-like domain [Cinara cedri]|uniref:CHK kinase-like domain-containing protein n=1 Tax=Cinara cedri TaxID=506608 RepID=A0A5E4NKW9_9HEMI|nr:Protein of unknown function DUF227,CHK kinase-like,Protein kinase-like domain [Cinara cedri]
MSVVSFGTLLTSDGSKYSVLIKCKTNDKFLREKLKIDTQFHNEIIMYEKIVPFLLTCRSSMVSGLCGPSIPRFFYGRNSFDATVENDLIILENVNPSGFRLSEERLFLDYEHLVIALQALAVFHGLSYIAKHVDPVGFREVIADVRDTQWDSDGRWLVDGNTLETFGKPGVDRLLERDRGGDGNVHRDSESLRRFNELIADGDDSLRRALEPREPLSVLCHGDFNRNNMLFRYDDRSGRPTDVLLFDLGTPRYGSPALDLAFVLYMNTSQQLRERRWDELLDVYCAALAAAVPTGVRVPTRAELDGEMVASALFGVAHVSFFMPYQVKKIAGAGPSKCDGDAGTEYLADVVQHFIGAGYAK